MPNVNGMASQMIFLSFINRLTVSGETRRSRVKGQLSCHGEGGLRLIEEIDPGTAAKTITFLDDIMVFFTAMEPQRS